MFLARVIGTVVASVKYEGLEAAKLLLVAPLDKDGKDISGPPIVACDEAQAGVGDHVFCVAAREASHALPVRFVPVDAAIVGIVDHHHREADV